MSHIALSRVLTDQRRERDGLWEAADNLCDAVGGQGSHALGHARSPRWPLVFGVLVVLVAAASFIDRMFYKIVPFLIWMHLQRQRRRTSFLMQGVISGRRMMIHFATHSLALVILLIAIFWRPATPLAAVFWVCAGADLGLNLALAPLSYRRALRPLSSA